jgi:hypothetical protein
VGVNVSVGGSDVNEGVKDGKGVAMIGVTGVLVFVVTAVNVGIGVGRVFKFTVTKPAQ